MPFRINLGGEGEAVGVLNQQPRGVVSPTWFSSVTAKSFVQLIADGLDILVCDNTALPFPDDTFEEVITNGARSTRRRCSDRACRPPRSSVY